MFDYLQENGKDLMSIRDPVLTYVQNKIVPIKQKKK